MFDKLEKINAKPKPFEFYTAEELWTDEHTSEQMLQFHLNESIDLSSRNHAFIDRSAEWSKTCQLEGERIQPRRRRAKLDRSRASQESAPALPAGAAGTRHPHPPSSSGAADGAEPATPAEPPEPAAPAVPPVPALPPEPPSVSPSVHAPVSSHVAGATQSSLLEQDVPQPPSSSHT